MGGMTVTEFIPDSDIPSLSGKVIFVTGGTAGIGKQTVLAMVVHEPTCIYFSGRDSKAAALLIDEANSIAPEVQVKFIQCDLASLGSVTKAANEFKESSQRLDILICNAGVCGVPSALTADGYEIQFGTNHLGHALLIKLLLPTLLLTAEVPGTDVRVISLTSDAFNRHPPGGIAFETLKTTQDDIRPGNKYGQSKLANVLYAAEMSRQYPKITTVAVHPGIVPTNITTQLPFYIKVLVFFVTIGRSLTLAQGAYNSLWAATCDKKNIDNGGFYFPVGVAVEHAEFSGSADLARKLWHWTQTELEAYPI